MTGDALAALARSFVGTPYRHQAAIPGVGMDCLGLVRALWRAKYGGEPVAIPAYRPDWRDIRSAPLLEAAAQELLTRIESHLAAAGDIVLFRFRRELPAKHCAVLVAPGRIVHAQERLGVVEVAFSPWWRRHAAGTFRFPEA